MTRTHSAPAAIPTETDALPGAEWADRRAHFRVIADPPADAAVESLAHFPPGEAQQFIERALNGKADSATPLALRQLVATAEATPAWVNPEQIALGGYTFLRCRLGFLVLACLSLPLVYSLPELNKALALSGRLVSGAGSRLKETTRFVFETCRAGGLEREAEGFRLTLSVRLIHAQVRRLLRKSGKWEDAAWGEPINQWHLAVTNTLFSQGVLEGLRTMGYLFRPEEADALMHLWRYSGFLSGIQTELVPTSEAQAYALREAAFRLEGPPDDDSRALVAGVMGAAQGYSRFGSDRVAYGVSRSFLGPARSAMLGYPETGWRHLIPLLRPSITLVERSRLLNVPGVRALARVCGTQAFRHLMSDRGLPGRMGEFELPSELIGVRARPR
jgi:hypothetical protein